MEEESCAVCAETVEWVAYGPCGHSDVCVTCIARLRFVCHDRHCCICKSPSSSIFVTKALGSFTRIINDFSILPVDAKEGKVGSYWYHEGIQAYFDDFDAYKIIKAVCRLSCSVCDKSEAEGRGVSKRRGRRFKGVEQLKDHLARQHEVFFCSLCLENKKVFICEQKLYSRAQLRQHIRDGDSEIDGDESERCGFSGHPLCQFCHTPYYGDNELYFHMSTEHYTCHICQRQYSGRYDYYKDYDDLENHFRRAHFLCEDGSCLEKKFIVFTTEADMKRHNALEHGGQMSRTKRNAALQLSTCFHYQEREEPHRVRPHFSGRGVSHHRLSSSTAARSERSSSNTLNNPSLTIQALPGHTGDNETGSTSDPIPSSIQAQSTSLDFRSVLLFGSAFPPLPQTSKRRRRKSKKNSGERNASTPGCSDSAGNVSYMSSVNQTSSPSTSGAIQSRAPPNAGHVSASSATSLSNGGSIKDMSPSSSASSLVGPTICGDGEDVQTANKSLVEGICAALEFDKDKFAAFKIISKEFRDSKIDAGEYLTYVHQFGLAHLISDLARLCPDPDKQKELMEIHKNNLEDVKEDGLRKESGKSSSAIKGSKKGKEICEDNGSISKGKALADNIVNNLKELKLHAKTRKEGPSSSKVVGHREKGKSTPVTAVEMSKLPATEPKNEDVGSSSSSGPAKGEYRNTTVGEMSKMPFSASRGEGVVSSNGSSSNSSNGTTEKGTIKKPKKNPKFLRTRLGEGSASMVTDVNCSDLASDPTMGGANQDHILASVRGVWRSGGGRRLVALSQASPSTR